MNVANVLSTKGARVITIHPEQSVRQAVALLSRHGIGALVVVDAAQKLVGIVTDRHIIRRLAEDDQVVSRTVGEIMTSEVVTGTPGDELAAIARAMAERRFRHLPIVAETGLAGIVSMGDILKAQRDAYRGEADTLATRVSSG